MAVLKCETARTDHESVVRGRVDLLARGAHTVGRSVRVHLGHGPTTNLTSQRGCAPVWSTTSTGSSRFYNGQPVNKDHGTYIRMAGVTHYHLRVPRRVICVYDTSDQFSFAWAAYRFDADYAADDSVEMEQGAIHGWWSAEAIGRPKYQWRRFYDGGLNFNPPSRADDAGVFRSSLRFLDGEDTDRWSRNS